MKILLALLILPVFSYGAEISVIGVCQRKVSPDMFSISVEISNVDKDLNKSFTTTNKEFKQVVEHYKPKFDIQTESINTSEEFEYKDRERKFVGYKTFMRASLETKNKEDMEQGIFKLASFKNSKISGLNTRVSQVKMKKEKDACFLEALEDAQKKTRRISEKIGEKQIKIKEIKELAGSENNFPRPMGNIQMMKSAQSTPIEVRDQDLEVEVSLVVETGP